MNVHKIINYSLPAVGCDGVQLAAETGMSSSSNRIYFIGALNGLCRFYQQY